MDKLQQIIKQQKHLYLNNSIFDVDKHKKKSLHQQLNNEQRLISLALPLYQQLKPLLREKDYNNMMPILLSTLLTIEKDTLLYDQPFINTLLENGFIQSLETFIQEMQIHDTSLSSTAIFQATRNVLMMNLFQIAFGQEVQLTPTIYAYSMMYPYTDNYLDDPSVNRHIKEEFNHKLTQRFTGIRPIAISRRDQKVYDLFSIIEKEYPRIDHPLIYERILLIQEAQSESLKQEREQPLPYDELLSIIFFKGASLALANATLVKENLGPLEIEFSMSLGILLQLLDDLQDIEQDLKSHRQTIMNTADLNVELPKLLSYLFNLSIVQSSDTKAIAKAKELIQTIGLLVIFDVIGKNPNLIKNDLYQQLQSLSGVRLSFFKRFKEFV